MGCAKNASVRFHGAESLTSLGSRARFAFRPTLGVALKVLCPARRVLQPGMSAQEGRWQCQRPTAGCGLSLKRLQSKRPPEVVRTPSGESHSLGMSERATG